MRLNRGRRRLIVLLGRLPGEWNRRSSRTSAHLLLHVPRNAHLPQLLLLLLLLPRAVRHNQTLLRVQELLRGRVLIILTFDGPAPRFDLTVAVGAHFSVCGGRVGRELGEVVRMVLVGVMMMVVVMVVLVALARSLLGHHGIEVMAAHPSCLMIVYLLVVM